MHPYSTDSDERRRISLALALLSIIAAYLFACLNIEILWWIETPSVVGFYGLFYYIFDRFIWKSKYLYKLNIVKIPDLNGNWSGYLESSYDNFESKKCIDFHINQRWTKIEIFLNTEYSTSRSLTASLLIQDLDSPLLSYEYINEPKSNAVETMHMHRGTARLNIVSHFEKMEGDHYTGRDRGEYGVIFLERTQKRVQTANQP